MEWEFRDYRISLNQAKDPLPSRDNVMEFVVKTNTKELDNNLKLQGCPSDLQDKFKDVVPEYWGVFCEYVFCRPIQGFLFQIDTGDHPPICCKPPRYGPPESVVMRNLAERLDETGVVEEYV